MTAVAVAAPVQPPLQLATVAAASADAEPKDASATPAQTAGKGKGLRAFRERLPLRRAFSTKHASLSTPALLSPVSQLGERPATSRSPRAKLTAFERFVNAKLATRKAGKKPKGTPEDVSVQEIPVAVELESVPSSSSSSASAEAEEALPAILESATAAEPEVAAPAEQASTNDATDPNPEPLPLARKIQSLLSALPPFLSPLSPPTPPATPAPGSDGGASNGEKKPADDTVDPSAPSTIDNSRLISLLSSPTMMNGSLSRGRQSVWALLDNLRIKSLVSSGNASSAEGSEGSADGSDVTMEDDDSVMFYAPLIPNAASTVELARSEIVSVDENGTIVDVILDDAPLPGIAPPKTGFGKIWPFSSGTTSTPATSPKPKVLTEKRVWVPSTTQLSLQVMWWGYRLWLPPSIMNLLNDKEIEAAKLSAMLTSALTWLLNNVPNSALPSTLRPALALVKSLVPYLGYIGGFVAWSWGAIKGFDIGNGVTLTATWLLPIALIPGTWEDSDVPQPPPPPSSGNPASDPGSSPPPSAPSSGDPSAPGASSPAPSGGPSVPVSSPSSPSGGSSTIPTTTPTTPAPEGSS
ncbi:hypothetical protein TRAPUB_10837 [Trametes pubescens]|uniref:Uncharacterized protein n=1 Tax=Trametes pubescens TaxID=154538 RepID=A0A1M2VYH9_TRAPU|nr:hypothetical protein TRAPUB_10837 [Trametes pubescens]